MFASLSKKLLSTGLSLLLLFSTSVFAEQAAMGGVIHFTGQIVEPPCNIIPYKNQLEMSCVRDGQMQRHRFSPQQVVSAPQHFLQIASARMQYLNKEKNLAIINIEYR